MKTKKIIGIVLGIFLLLTISTTSNAVETTYTATGETSTGETIQWSYELNEQDQVINLKCTNLTDITGNVEIPSSINEKTVKTIGQGAFENCSGITGVTIPSSVIEIGNNAFKDCLGIKTLNLTEGLQKIGQGAFQNCSGITNVVLPNTVTVVSRWNYLRWL